MVYVGWRVGGASCTTGPQKSSVGLQIHMQCSKEVRHHGGSVRPT